MNKTYVKHTKNSPLCFDLIRWNKWKELRIIEKVLSFLPVNHVLSAVSYTRMYAGVRRSVRSEQIGMLTAMKMQVQPKNCRDLVALGTL